MQLRMRSRQTLLEAPWKILIRRNQSGSSRIYSGLESSPCNTLERKWIMCFRLRKITLLKNLVLRKHCWTKKEKPKFSLILPKLHQRKKSYCFLISRSRIISSRNMVRASQIFGEHLKREQMNMRSSLSWMMAKKNKKTISKWRDWAGVTNGRNTPPKKSKRDKFIGENSLVLPRKWESWECWQLWRKPILCMLK